MAAHPGIKVSSNDPAELLRSIDDRLERIEDKLTRAELTFAGFLAGPGKKLLKLFGNGGD